MCFRFLPTVVFFFGGVDVVLSEGVKMVLVVKFRFMFRVHI